MAAEKWEITDGEAFGDYDLMIYGEWCGTYPTAEAAAKAYQALTRQPRRSWEVGGPDQELSLWLGD
jgi:hypothetical protein